MAVKVKTFKMRKKKFNIEAIPTKKTLTSVETAGEGGTNMGRLASRMAARDMIDGVNLGPKSPSPTAKAASIADMSSISKMHSTSVLDSYDHHKNLALKRGTEQEMEHTTDPELAKRIAMKNLEEFPNYYDERIGLPNMEAQLQRYGNEPVTKTTPGRNMAEQARNAGNVFETRNK